jgi:hypothetical protein
MYTLIFVDKCRDSKFLFTFSLCIVVNVNPHIKHLIISISSIKLPRVTESEYAFQFINALTQLASPAWCHFEGMLHVDCMWTISVHILCLYFYLWSKQIYVNWRIFQGKESNYIAKSDNNLRQGAIITSS